MRCGYQYCQHNHKIEDGQEYVHKNKYYYHKDCYNTMCDLKYLENQWLLKVNRLEPVSNIQKAFYGYVYNMGIETDYIIFTLEYVLNHHFCINYPQGLKYYFGNAEIQKAYRIKQSGAAKIKMEDYLKDQKVKPALEESADKIGYKQERKKTSFEEMFGFN